MGDLKLPNLRIENFRCFRDVKINQLGRVNLIVGKNNVGKTSLLEAIEFHARRGHAGVLMRSLQRRDEVIVHGEYDPRAVDDYSDFQKSDLFDLVSGLFHKDQIDSKIRTSGGGLDVEALVTSLGRNEWVNLLTSELIDEKLLDNVLSRSLMSEEIPCVLVQSDERIESGVSLNHHFLKSSHRSIFTRRSTEGSVETLYTSSRERSDLLAKWDLISLTPEEKHVYESMQVVLPDLDRMTFKRTSTGRPVPYILLKNNRQPFPLRRMGDGTERLFLLGLTLVNARDGFVCIDEIETGLHYTLLEDVWRVILQTARSLNIQVFATTHSLDAVKAFEKVANEQKEEDGVLVQLRRRRSDNDIVAVTSEEEELKEALALNVDPR